MEILIVLVLIILNGVFAMAEIAIVSSRKSKLQQLSQDGDIQARKALEIANNPSRFLSTVQIGITLVGIFAGAFGGATIASSLSDQLSVFPLLDPYSNVLSLAIVVGVITYLSLIIGELVPKNIALSNPEKIAFLVSSPMNMISKFASPLVTLLSFSTDVILKVFHIKHVAQPSVTDEEIRLLIREGAKTGAFELGEQDIVERTLKLSDKRVKSLMTSRKEIVWLDVDSPFKTIRNKIIRKPHAHFPVCKGTLDKILGIIRTENLLVDFLADEKIILKKSMHKPLFVPESMDVFKVLELFKKSGIHMALVSDEYGNTQGLITITDIMEEIVGDIPTLNDAVEKEIVKRLDGTFLVDGLVSIEEFKEYFGIKRLAGEKSGVFHTVGGFITTRMGRIPLVGDNFIFNNHKYEVMDMDGTRVDKILVYDQIILKKSKSQPV